MEPHACCREEVWDTVNSCEEDSAPNHRCLSLIPSKHPSVRTRNITVHTATVHSNRADRMCVRRCAIHFDEEEGPLEDGLCSPPGTLLDLIIHMFCSVSLLKKSVLLCS